MRRVKKAHLPWYWPKYEGDIVHGISCDGDLEVGATTGWWSIVSGIFWRWKTVVILKPKLSQEIYIGFVAHDGTTLLCKVPVPAKTAFGMLVGHEPATFFAMVLVEDEWQEVELELVATVRRNDPTYKNVPLY